MDINLRDFIKSGYPAFGTCAGLVLLARKAIDRKTDKELTNTLGLLDIVVKRNYYGRQKGEF